MKVKQISGVKPEKYAQLNLAGQDLLGRCVLGAHGYANKVDVGIFYSLWHGQHANVQKDILDIQKEIDKGNEEQLMNGPENIPCFHYWGEPLYGYYRSTDKWVAMRHMELLTQAGIDFICIDATNDWVYENCGHTVLGVLLELYNAGFGDVIPKVCFYTNSNSANTIKVLKQTYYEYKNGIYDPLWYKPNGKPLIMGTTTNNVGSDVHYNTTIPKNLYDATNETYFEIKESQWPNYQNEDPNGIPWMHWSKWRGKNRPNKTGYMSIPVAQHAQTDVFTCSVSDKKPEASRGYNTNTGEVVDIAGGTSFQCMWDDAFDCAKEGTLKGAIVTGWNEWIAQKQPSKEFVDVYNTEFSRDVEMMANGKDKGGHADNFYMQLVQNVRKMKYLLHDGGEVEKHAEKTVDIFDVDYQKAWSGVSATYRDFIGDALARNCQNAANGGATQATYVDDTNRNDINNIKVANDGENLYMYVDCVDEITAHEVGDTAWMNVLIGTEYGDNTFGGFRYVINREPDEKNTTSVHEYINGEWVKVATARYNLNGKVITFKIPLSAIGGSSSIRFKVSDNVKREKRFESDPIMNYYVTGDSAPLGRLGYTYNF